MEKLNEDYDLLPLLLQKIISDEQLHAKWLNTLSFLEYIGSRKILKSQQADQMELFLLQHASEEARHAAFFKKICLKLDGGSCRTYASEYLLNGSQAEDYFQDLDRSCEELLAESFSGRDLSFATYLYVTYLVETRAMDLYEKYQQLLEEQGLGIHLKSLLKEESHHLKLMEKQLSQVDPGFEKRKKMLGSLEQSLYERYLLGLSALILPYLNRELNEQRAH